MVDISIVVPVYESVESLGELCIRLNGSIREISDSFEIILVNDGSADASWECIEMLSGRDPNVKGINLSRNFGQHYAIAAGLDYAQGKWVVVMDCDLQDLPEEVPNLYKKALEGYDQVVARRGNRELSLIKNAQSALFYFLLSRLSDVRLSASIGNFGIYSERVIRAICSTKEQGRSFGVLAQWVGFRRTELQVKSSLRVYGSSSYTFSRLISLALDSILFHSARPLVMTVKFGFLLSFLSILYATWNAIKYYLWGVPVEGWTSIIISIFLFSGIIIICIGIVGLYIGKIFDQVKNRPLYIIESTTMKVN